jgi:hypothetical protein
LIGENACRLGFLSEKREREKSEEEAYQRRKKEKARER